MPTTYEQLEENYQAVRIENATLRKEVAELEGQMRTFYGMGIDVTSERDEYKTALEEIRDKTSGQELYKQPYTIAQSALLRVTTRATRRTDMKLAGFLAKTIGVTLVLCGMAILFNGLIGHGEPVTSTIASVLFFMLGCMSAGIGHALEED